MISVAFLPRKVTWPRVSTFSQTVRGLARCYSTDSTSAPESANPARFKLRDYQVDAVNNVLEAVESGIKRPAVVLATGGGKTMVMAHIVPRIKAANKRRTKTLILAHKQELVLQAARTVRAVNPDMAVDIDMSKQKPTLDTEVVVGSVGTLVRLTRLHQYDPAEYKTIVIDECHHAPAQSWIKILDYFGALEPDSEIVTLGFTATLERTDGKPLGQVFDKVVYQRDLSEMIREGELCDARFSTMKVNVDLDNVNVVSGDYSQSALGKAVNTADINAQVAKAYVQLRKQLKLKSTLVFCVDVDHCKTLCGVLQAHGVNAQYVCGTTASHVRQSVLEDFKNGNIDVLCNVLVFTEGTDIPNIDSLILARPTKSRPLLTQIIGRGLRLHQGKDVCHIIDMVHTMKIGVSSVPTLFGLPPNHRINEKSFAQLEVDKEDLEQKNLEQEKQLRQEEVRRVLDYQRQMQNTLLQFDVVTGVAAMLKSRVNEVSDHPEHVREAFRNSGRHWIRLEYNVWGLPLPNTDSYLSMKRVVDKEGEFELYEVRPVSFHVLKASNFKCPRKQEYLVNEGSLEYLLNVANSACNRRPFQPISEKPVTKKQAEYLYNVLMKRTRNLYGASRLPDFKGFLSEMTMHRASNLIFAAKYSVNSLWVTWELRNLMGVPPDLLKSVRKKLRKTEDEMARLGMERDQKWEDSSGRLAEMLEGEKMRGEESRGSSRTEGI